MSTIKEHLFEELLANFLELNRDIDALIISDQEGFIIAGEKRKGIDLEIVSVLTTLINPILDRMRNEFAFKKFGTASFDTDLHRLLFISIDQNTTLSIVLNNMASIDKISPYAYFFAEKVAQILDSGESDSVDISMPIFETEADSGANSGRMKQQIYQMRLEKYLCRSLMKMLVFRL